MSARRMEYLDQKNRELNLVRQAMLVLERQEMREKTQEELILWADMVLSMGFVRVTELGQKQTIENYVNWCNRRNTALYRQMWDAIDDAPIGQRSPATNPKVWELIVAHASLVVPDFKP